MKDGIERGANGRRWLVLLHRCEGGNCRDHLLMACCEFADLRPATLPPAARQVKAGFQTTSFVSLPHSGAAFTPRLISLPPVLETSSELGRRSFHSAITPGCAAPSPSPNWRRASRRALRCGQPACSGQWRRRHGSGELPSPLHAAAISRGVPPFAKASTRSPRVGSRCPCRQLVLRPQCASVLVAVEQPPSSRWSASWLRQSFSPAWLCCSAQAPAQPLPIR